MNRNRVSIIIPIYNKEPYLNHCFQSILEQSYENIEIILVDDGSIDDSGKLCKKIASENSKFTYIYQENKGQTLARMRGLEAARSEYIAYIDADDWIDEKYISTLMNAINEDGKLDLVSSGIIYEDGNKGRIQKDGIPSGIYENLQLEEIRGKVIYNEDSNGQGITHSMSGKVFKKALLKKAFAAVNPKITIFEDGVAIFSYIGITKKIKVLNYVGYHYMQYSDSSIHTIGEDKLYSVSLLKENYIEIAKKLNIYENVKKEIAKHISFTYAMVLGREMGLEYVDQYIIPKFMIEKDTSVVIYGAGERGIQFEKQIRRYRSIKLVGWIDRNYREKRKELGIQSPQDICQIKYDYLVVAIENMEVVHDVIKKLMEIGVPYEKIIILNHRYVYQNGKESHYSD